MINIFAIATNDQSIYYLGRIFGNVGTVLSGTGPALLGAMFKVFNTAILAVGALVIAYVTVVGVLKTAQEGEFLGRQWNSLWVPVRLVFGIAGLMPTASGYCLMQMIMMWVIMQGVGAADTVWSATIDYLERGGATQTPVPATGTNLNANNSIPQIFAAIVCQEAVRKYYCVADTSGNEPAWCSAPVNFLNNTSWQIGPDGICGTLNQNTSVSPAALTLAQWQAFNAMIPTLTQVADFYVNAWDAFATYANPQTSSSTAAQGGTTQSTVSAPSWLPADVSTGTCSTGSTTGNDGGCSCQSSSNCSPIQNLFWSYAVYPYTGSNFIRDAVNLYQGYIFNALTSSSAGGTSAGSLFGSLTTGGILGPLASLQSLTVNVTGTLETARANGWIFAGAYYYFIANMNNSVLSSVDPSINFTAGSSVDASIKTYTNNPNATGAYDNVGFLTAYIQAQQANGGGEGSVNTAIASSGNPIIDKVTGSLGTYLIQGWMTVLAGSPGSSTSVQTNPIVAIQSFGEGLLTAIEIAFGVMLLAIFLAASLANIMSSVQPLGYALTDVLNVVQWPLLFLMGALFVMAGTFAVYVPLIPYILFTFGAIGWFINAIVIMVGAPLVALAMMSPEGNNEVWGKAEPAIGVLLAVFLRPTLMVFGMIAGMLLSYVVVTFINAAFLGVIQSILPSPGLVEILFFMCIYTSLIITALNKCFALISVVPDNALSIIGVSAATFGGEAEALGQAKEGAVAGIGGAKEAGGAAHAKGKELKAEGDAKAVKKQDAAGDIGISATPPKKGGAGGKPKPPANK